MNKNRKPRFFYGYIIVLAAFIVQIVGWMMYSAYGVFFGPMITEFGWMRAVTSGPYSLYLVIQGLLSIVMGRINDRFGPRVVTIACGSSLGLGYLLLSQISDIWQLYLFFGVLVGIGMACIWVPLLSTVSRWFVRRRALMCGIISAGFVASIAVMPLVAGWLVSIYGWRESYIIFAVITLVIVIGASLLMKRDPCQMGLSPYGRNEPTGANLNLQLSGLSLQQAIYTRQLWLLSGVYVLFLLSFAAYAVHIVIHATGLGISLASAANILVISGAVSFPGGIILAGASDKIGGRLVLSISCMLLVIASLCLQFADGLWMFYLFAIIFTLGYASGVALMSTIVAELFGTSSHGVILGVVNFSATIGCTVGPVLTGYIFDVTGSYQVAFLVCAAVSLIGLIITLFIKPIHRKKEAGS